MLFEINAQDEARAAQYVHGRHMASALMCFVGMPRGDNHHDGGYHIGSGEQQSVLHRGISPVLQGIREEIHAAVGGAVMEEINEDHDENRGLAKLLPQGWRASRRGVP